MVIKKLNAVCSWILIALLLVHIFTTLLYMAADIYNLQLMMKVPRILAMVCILHICFSLWIVFFMHDGSKFDRYGKLNQRTFMQRLSGLLILALVHLHVKIFASFIYDHSALSPARKLLVFVVEMMFFAAIYVHLECSFSRSLITMGLIRSEKTEHAIDIAARTFSAVFFALTFIILARFLITWPTA